jgi:hypothetical protein
MQKKEIICFFEKSFLYLNSKFKVMDFRKVLIIFTIFICGFLLGIFTKDSLLIYSNSIRERVHSHPIEYGYSIDDENSKEIYKKYTYKQDLSTILELAYEIDSVHAYYINRYVKLSIKEQELFGFPASVKLAQFLVEGGFSIKEPKGSKLVLEGNNPFGIKYFGNSIPNRIENWHEYAYVDDFIYATDDCIGQCKFIKFKGIWHSFRYHSVFIVGTESNPSHYIKYVTEGDWNDWLTALQKGGYATADHYKYTLRDVIIRYKLYLLDDYKTIHL